MRMRPEVRMGCDALSKAPAMASATYHSNSKARLISAVTEDVLGGTLTESYTYNFPGGVTIDYNYLNLTRKISGTGGTLVKYSYLANGSKTGAENGSGAGLVYRGSLIYKKASGGTLTFDGARSSASTSRARKTRPRTSPSRSRTSVRDSTARPSAAGWPPTP